MLEVITPGLIASVQDLGRQGYMHMGVSRSGALDPLSLHLANRLVNNPANTPAIEILMPPASYIFHEDCWIALTGSSCKAFLDETPVWFGWRVPVKKGQTLKLGPARNGLCSYLAVSGGIVVPQVMSSGSTDLKSQFGGYRENGASLTKGDQLTIGHSSHIPKEILGIKLPVWDHKIRAIVGPEFDQFSEQSQQLFFTCNWSVGSSSNRMGFRLSGPELTRIENKDILSQGVYSGVIQVPPNGQPIILAAEAQSTGGYPRIATIIQADFWKLGQARIGQYLYFEKCSIAEAKQALIKQNNYLNKIEYLLENSR